MTSAIPATTAPSSSARSSSSSSSSSSSRESTPLLLSSPSLSNELETILIEEQEHTSSNLSSKYKPSRIMAFVFLLGLSMICAVSTYNPKFFGDQYNHLRFTALGASPAEAAAAAAAVASQDSAPLLNANNTIVGEDIQDADTESMSSSNSTAENEVIAQANKANADKPCDIGEGGVSFCPGTLPGNVEAVHLKPGCLLVSTNDLTTMERNPHYSNSPTLTVCASMSTGVVMVDVETLKKYGMLSSDGKKSLISSLLFSDDTQIKLFSGSNFDGQVIGSLGTPYNDPYTKVLGLTGQRYANDPHELVNDNVKSFLFATSSVEMNSCTEALYWK